MRKGFGVILAAAAAFGLYKYRRMTPEQRKDLHQKGKSFIDKYGGFKNIFRKKTAVHNPPAVNTRSTVHTPTY